MLLLGKGARVDVQDKDGATALMWASANGHEEVVKLLLGEDVTIHLSAHELEHFDALMTSRRAAIKQGVTDDAGGKEVIVNFAQSVTIDKQNNKGYSALMWASEYGHKEVAELLLDKGAQVDLPSSNGSTAMLWRAGSSMKVVEMLHTRRRSRSN